MGELDKHTVSCQIASVRPIRDIIYDYLRNAILDGHLAAGERIVERDFAEMFGASRTPIREAIRKLEMEGLLDYIPRKGVVVKGIDLAEIVEIYSIRQALEALAFKTAIAHLSEQDHTSLENIMSKLRQVGQLGDAEVLIKGLEEFDGIIMDASHMPRLKDFIRTLQESIRRFRKLNLSDEERRAEAISEHTAILSAILNKDLVQTEQLVKLHIANACQHLIKTYRQIKRTSPNTMT